MTAKELFAVIVRAIGLVLLVAGILGLGIRAIDHVLLPPYEPSGGEGALAAGYAFVTVVGILLLFATRKIVQLFYASDTLH